MEFSSITNSVRQFLRPAEEKLYEHLTSNPYFPFHVISPNVFYLSFRYKTLYISILVLLICTLALIIWISTNAISNNNLFLFPMMGIIVSIASINNHWPKRTYVINLNEKYYSFSHGKTIYTKGHLHNIYIRLKKDAKSGSTVPTYICVVASRQNSYHLLLNGYQIDPRKISGSTTNQIELRKLGQQMAFQLQINYFDEHNTSEHHVIRHLRPAKSTKKGGMNLPASRLRAISGVVWAREKANEKGM